MLKREMAAPLPRPPCGADKGELFSDRRWHSIAWEQLACTLFFEVISDCSSFPQPPNKAPEPTPTAVTPRAIEVVNEMKRWICNRIEARVVPAVGVAHL
jgi:hypothetical protein